AVDALCLSALRLFKPHSHAARGNELIPMSGFQILFLIINITFAATLFFAESTVAKIFGVLMLAESIGYTIFIIAKNRNLQ
ncbi:hypothetical protein, partial [Methylomagnum sp.]